MRSIKKCPICNNRRLSKLKVVDGIPILECKKCQLGISSRNKKIDLYHTKVLYDSKQYRKSEERQVKKFEHIAKLVKSLNIKSVLEVGAGYGLFSKILSQNKKLSLEIVEPYLKPIYAKSIKNIKIHNVTFDDFFKKTKTRKVYDLVVFLDVFEHLVEPREVLKKVKKLLNKDGDLLILLPNYRSLMAKICRNWSWWMIEDHKWHFSPQSMEKLLVSEGFKLEILSSFEDFYDFKKNLDGNFEKVRLSLIRWIQKGFFFLFFLPLYFLFRKMLWKLNYGGLLLVIARRG